MEINYFQKRQKRYDFVAEACLVTSVAGAFLFAILEFIISLIAQNFQGYFFLFSRIISFSVVGIMASISLAILLRVSIFILEKISIRVEIKSTITIIIGLITIFMVGNFFLEIIQSFKRGNWVLLLVFALSYFPPFIYWFLRKNIWDTDLKNVISSNKHSDRILDDID